MLKNKIFEAGNKFRTNFGDGDGDVPAKKRRKTLKMVKFKLIVVKLKM